MDDLAIVDHPQCSICLEDWKTQERPHVGTLGKPAFSMESPGLKMDQFFFGGDETETFRKTSHFGCFLFKKNKGDFGKFGEYL